MSTASTSILRTTLPNDDDENEPGSSLFAEEIDPENCVVYLRTESFRNLHKVLRAVQFREHGLISVSTEGFKVTVDEHNCIQARVLLQPNVFKLFIVREDEVKIQLSLKVLCECLNLFGDTSSSIHGAATALVGGGPASTVTSSFRSTLCICYEGLGYPLNVLLEDDENMLTKCAIKTETPEPILDFDFSPENIVSRVIITADSLRETFAELDTSSDNLEIRISPDNPCLRFATRSQVGEVTTEYPRDSEVIEDFSCERPQLFKYRMDLLKCSVKALVLAQKVAIRLDDRGFLSMQYLIDLDDGRHCFVGYFFSPDVDSFGDSQ